MQSSCLLHARRNYRACVRAHQGALAAQRALWATLLHDTLTFEGLRTAFATMQKAEAQASRVYRRCDLWSTVPLFLVLFTQL